MFDFVLAIASISAKCPAWSALRLNAVIASVTMSETVPRFSPLAAARFITPGKAASILLVSQPAIAIYFKASADSVAENFVFAPISSAFFVSFLRSSPVAPDIACTSDIAALKSLPTLKAYPPIAVIAAPAPSIDLVTPAPIALIFDSPFLKPLASIFVSKINEPS